MNIKFNFKINKEKACYAASGALGLAGFILIILGIIADNLKPSSELNKAQASFKFRWLGLIFIGAAVAFALIVLLVNAKKTDRVIERETRRKQRLNAMMYDIKKDEQTVVVENGKIVNETKTINDTSEDVHLEATNNNLNPSSVNPESAPIIDKPEEK